MVDVVIIGRDEGAWLEAMLSAMPKGWRVIYIADRCEDGTFGRLMADGRADASVNTWRFCFGDGRMTSTCRNYGCALRRQGADVLFLDGDRVPSSADDLRAAVEACQTDVLLLPLEEDGRTPEVFANAYGRVMNGFYSCGLFIKADALRRVEEFQGGKVFDEELQRWWGVEDTYLGDVCYHLGLTASLTDKVRLRGSFTKTRLDTLDALKARFRKRDRLDVLW